MLGLNGRPLPRNRYYDDGSAPDLRMILPRRNSRRLALAVRFALRSAWLRDRGER